MMSEGNFERSSQKTTCGLNSSPQVTTCQSTLYSPPAKLGKIQRNAKFRFGGAPVLRAWLTKYLSAANSHTLVVEIWPSM